MATPEEKKSDFPTWVRPSHGAFYDIGDRVLYNGVVWESDLRWNVGEPGADDGWIAFS